jgi:hypothetical protein
MLNMFTRILVVDGQNHFFRYLRVYSINGYIYIVTVKHQDKIHLFHLKQNEEKWSLVHKGQVPPWLQEIEVDLVQGISEENKAITG